MTSSLKSRFDFFNRRALLVTADRARVYHWHQGQLEGIYTFDLSDQGLSLFEEYLQVNSTDPLYILTDLGDEEFRLDSVPHVMGRDRRAMLERRQSKLFRHVKYSYSEIQGRDSEGRRDDRVLFAALTEDEALQPWLIRLESQKVPIAGIHSVAMLTRSLLKPLGHGGGPALVVSLQRNAGLRQSFFQGEALKFSRLVRLPRYGTESYAPIMAEEMDKMLRYLRSMRQITSESLVQVYLLVDDALQQELKDVTRDSTGLKYKLIKLDQLSETIGYKTDFVDPFAESLYIYQLLKNRNRNVYATETETRYFKLRNLRNTMLVSSLFVLLGAFLWSGLAFVEGVTLKQQALNAHAKTAFYQERYEMAKEQLPELPLEPDDLKKVVEVADSLKSYHATPLPIMQTVSQSLENFPDIGINSIKWLASMTPDTRIEERSSGNSNIKESGIATDKYTYYQIANVAGRLRPFAGNYREAIAQVNRFAESLRQNANIHDVEIMELPLDVSSEAQLRGTGEGVREEAEFLLRIVQGIKNET